MKCWFLAIFIRFQLFHFRCHLGIWFDVAEAWNIFSERHKRETFFSERHIREIFFSERHSSNLWLMMMAEIKNTLLCHRKQFTKTLLHQHVDHRRVIDLYAHLSSLAWQATIESALYQSPLINTWIMSSLILQSWASFTDTRFTVCWSMMTSSNGNIFRVTGPLCGEFTGPGEFPTQRTVTRSFDVFFDLRLNKWLSKQPWGWWLETPSWSLWRQCNAWLYKLPAA